MPRKQKPFWDYVEKTDACWTWKAHRHNQGYGLYWFNGRDVMSHRVSWTLTHGEIPKGLHVLHKCDNPPCVRPDHLFIGTHQDNMTDAMNKGRLIGAKLAARTHCKYGHIFNESNTLIQSDGRSRTCKICAKEMHRRSYLRFLEKKKQEAWTIAKE